MGGRGQVGLVTEARALEHARHEADAAIVEVRHDVSVLGEGGDGDAAVGLRPTASVVHEVHAARAAHEVERGQGDREDGGQEEVDVPQAMEPGEEVVGAELPGFAENDGGKRHGDDDEEVVHDDLVQGFELLDMGWRADHVFEARSGCVVGVWVLIIVYGYDQAW